MNETKGLLLTQIEYQKAQNIINYLNVPQHSYYHGIMNEGG